MDPRERMLRLLALLQSGRAWPAPDLAAALGSTERTLRRDVDFLREQGYPVESVRGPGGHYRFASGRALPPLVLDDDEAIAVALGLRLASVGSLGVALERDAADRSLAKLRRMLPSRLRARTDALLSAVEAEGASRPMPSAGVLARVSAAIAEARVVTFDHARHDGVRRRTVEPYRLVALDGQWYLFAWDLDRDDWRTFKLNRVANDTTTDETYPVRPLPSEDIAGYVAKRFREPAALRVVLDLSVPVPDAARRLHRVDGTLETLTETTSRYTAIVDSFEWLAMVLVVSDIEFLIVEPAAFSHYVDGIVGRFSRALARGHKR